MVTLKTTCNNMSTLSVSENGDSTQSISGRSRLLCLKVNTKRRNVVLTVLSEISKMGQLSPNYIAICNHSIKESSASVILRRIILEIEELEGSKEIATTERDLRKLHKEKDQTYHLVTYEGQYKYNIAVFKKMHRYEQIH